MTNSLKTQSQIQQKMWLMIKSIPPTVRGYTWFLARDDRHFRVNAIYVHPKWAKLVAKVPDEESEMDLKIIHLRISTLPTLHILGAYLDCSPTVKHAAKIQVRLEEKIKQIKAWDEKCLLIGYLTRPVDKPTELPKTRIMQSWFESGKVELLIDQNYRKNFHRKMV